MKNLHPGAKWIFRARIYLMFILLSFWIVPFILSASLIAGALNPTAGVIIFFTLLFLPVVMVIGIAEVYAHMSYSRWLYDFLPEGIRIERGIIWKKYNNIPYDRIQNVDIQRGIFARMIGFSTLQIQTAGYSAGYGAFAEGNIPAIDVAECEKVRAQLMKRISGGK